MDLVHNDDAVVPADAEQADRLAQVADVVHAGVGGGVDLDDIGRVARGDLTAREALVARLAIARVGAVDGLGEQARGARFAGAARAAEEVRMGEAPVADGVQQRADDGLLTDQIGEGLRAPFAIERLRRHEMAPKPARKGVPLSVEVAGQPPEGAAASNIQRHD